MMTGYYEEGIGMYSDIIEQKKEDLNIGYIEMLGNLGEVRYSNGEQLEALSLWEKARTIINNYLGKIGLSHPSPNLPNHPIHPVKKDGFEDIFDFSCEATIELLQSSKISYFLRNCHQIPSISAVNPPCIYLLHLETLIKLHLRVAQGLATAQKDFKKALEVLES